jgi:hypothetical protein
VQPLLGNIKKSLRIDAGGNMDYANVLHSNLGVQMQKHFMLSSL